ncbi:MULTISPECIES: transglutaminase-like cysteine peptidase [Mesorhizobium]|uniref:Transglutaminase n=1 Tax=Mesorhizobium denitrificans TaxID=2294114 RepID=A0A371XJ56_9HYPH|nr:MULTISPECIES: transglutaminase-like cysteine peptidase [Mesorhizobium]RFC69255.1 transglutaminase [Mesorhizobium denitrificans]
MGRAATNSISWIGAALSAGTALLALSFGTLAASAGTTMVVGGLTSQPIGHYEYCKANPQECAIRTRDTAPEHMSETLWAKISRVNLAVNANIKPMSDSDIYGKDEVWTLPTHGVGDCEDYVLEKQMELHKAGLSLTNLLITVVRKPDGEGHAVLTVRTDEGDFVLDNLSDDVREWADTGYLYLKRQSEENTGRWVAIRKGQTSTVASVRE